MALSLLSLWLYQPKDTEGSATFTGLYGHHLDDIFVHIDVCDGMVWLQHDGTNLRLAEDLVRAGIPKEHIVLAFHHPSRRPDTEFAVA